MKVVYDKHQALSLWTQSKRFGPLRSEASVVRYDAAPSETDLLMGLRCWYLRLLDSGPLRLLAPEEVKDRLSVAELGDGVWELRLPDEVRRLTSIRLEGWPGEFVPVPEDSPRGALLRNPLAGPGAVSRDRSVELRLPQGVSELNLVSAMGIVEPPEDEYAFDERAVVELFHYNEPENMKL